MDVILAKLPSSGEMETGEAILLPDKTFGGGRETPNHPQKLQLKIRYYLPIRYSGINLELRLSECPTNVFLAYYMFHYIVQCFPAQ